MYHATKILEDKAKIDFAWNMTDSDFKRLYDKCMGADNIVYLED